MLFGVTGSSLNDWLCFGLCCLIIFDGNSHKKIEMRLDGKIRLWKEVITANYLGLDNSYLAVDERMLLLQK
jgi:hypothetical protein